MELLPPPTLYVRVEVTEMISILCYAEPSSYTPTHVHLNSTAKYTLHVNEDTHTAELHKHEQRCQFWRQKFFFYLILNFTTVFVFTIIITILNSF